MQVKIRTYINLLISVIVYANLVYRPKKSPYDYFYLRVIQLNVNPFIVSTA